MRISFIGCRENTINFFREMAEILSEKVSGLELEERFVPFIEDIPVVALEEAKESDFVFVYAIVGDKDNKKMLIEKLIDIEIQSGTRILKAIEDDSYSGMEIDDFNDAKKELAGNYSSIIISVLFNEEDFEPKERDLGE